MKPPPLVGRLLHPTFGVMRGIMTDVVPGKGGPDKDDRLIKIRVGELRDIDTALRELNAEAERAWRAYQIAQDQAMANGSALAELRAAAADTRPQGEDALAASFTSGAVPDRADAQPSSSQPSKE